jgi:hypothetical protein
LFIKFQITSSGSIRVTELPSVPRIVAKLDKKKMPEHLMDQVKQKDKGVTLLSKSQLDDLRKTYGIPIAPTAASEISNKESKDKE